jgi:hypothetical protein
MIHLRRWDPLSYVGGIRLLKVGMATAISLGVGVGLGVCERWRSGRLGGVIQGCGSGACVRGWGVNPQSRLETKGDWMEDGEGRFLLFGERSLGAFGSFGLFVASQVAWTLGCTGVTLWVALWGLGSGPG